MYSCGQTTHLNLYLANSPRMHSCGQTTHPNLYLVSSAVATAPFISGITLEIFTT